MPEHYLGFLMLSSPLRLLVTESDDYWNKVSRGDLMRRDLVLLQHTPWRRSKMGRYIAPRITSCNVMVYGSVILVGWMLVETFRWISPCV